MLFTLLDYKETEKIGIEEIKRVINDSEIGADNCWANVLLKYDKDGDQKLTFEEFSEFLLDNSC
jgi:Ca2+-binding EF-hand superfamily protein